MSPRPLVTVNVPAPALAPPPVVPMSAFSHGAGTPADSGACGVARASGDSPLIPSALLDTTT